VEYDILFNLALPEAIYDSELWQSFGSVWDEVCAWPLKLPTTYCLAKDTQRADDVVSDLKRVAGDWWSVPQVKWPIELWERIASTVGGFFGIDGINSSSAALAELNSFNNQMVSITENSYYLSLIFDPWAVIADLDQANMPANWVNDFGGPGVAPGGAFPPPVAPPPGAFVPGLVFQPYVFSNTPGRQKFVWVYQAQHHAETLAGYIRGRHQVPVVLLRVSALIGQWTFL
jgi:hypothetical protein